MDSLEDGAALTLSSVMNKERNMQILNSKFRNDFWIFIKMGQMPCVAWRLASFLNDKNVPEFLKEQA
ncbi:MAG: hypothetical protein KGM99_14850 [Burkholderiales bacterium]|nr:hypothetical protein [Burkholderiales bacterium]